MDQPCEELYPELKYHCYSWLCLHVTNKGNPTSHTDSVHLGVVFEF